MSQNEKLPALNTDRELWREKPGDYYSDSIHVTEGGGIGLNCGGCVIVMPIRKWHALAEAAQVTPPPSLIDKLNKAKWDFTREERNEVNLMLDAYQKKIASGGETEAAPDSVGSPQTLPLDLISETLHSMFLGDLIMKRLKEVADSVGAAPAAQKENAAKTCEHCHLPIGNLDGVWVHRATLYAKCPTLGNLSKQTNTVAAPTPSLYEAAAPTFEAFWDLQQKWPKHQRADVYDIAKFVWHAAHEAGRQERRIRNIVDKH